MRNPPSSCGTTIVLLAQVANDVVDCRRGRSRIWVREFADLRPPLFDFACRTHPNPLDLLRREVKFLDEFCILCAVRDSIQQSMTLLLREGERTMRCLGSFRAPRCNRRSLPHGVIVDRSSPFSRG